jgi:DNA invertase Pin-like site-specific DNA recombinase
MSRKNLKQAVGYLRTSSAANVGADKDSEKRQRSAIEAYAKASGVEVVGWYYDEAVSGADHVADRPGFVSMMERLLSNGCRCIIVETANRFARDLIVQETGYAMLKGQGVELIAADSPDAFQDDTPTAKLIRQILGAVSEFEKSMIVAKLRGARERKRRDEHGKIRKDSHGKPVKIEGRKNYQEAKPVTVAMAKTLHRYPKDGRRRSLRDVAKELAVAGHVTSAGKPYAAAAIAKMIEADLPRKLSVAPGAPPASLANGTG